MNEHMQKCIDEIVTIDEKLSWLFSCDKLLSYNTGAKVHQKQVLFHKSQKRNRWVFGGNRSGKTECGAVESVWLARGVHPYRKNKKDVCGWVVSLSTKVQKMVAQKKFLSYLNPDWIENIVMSSGRKDSPESGVVDTIFIRNVFGGISEISFKSCEEGRDKFQGASLDFVWFDEEPPQDIYDECLMRVMDKSGDIFGTMTPLKGLTFVYDRIYLNSANDDEVFCVFMEWADNPFLPKKEIERLQKSLPDEELEARRYGKFVDVNLGLVYREFDPSFHVVEPFCVPTDWYETISIDPGLNNPLSAHWYAVDYDGNIFVLAEHFMAGKNVDYHAKEIKRICNNLGWKRGSNGMFCAIIDSAASQKTLSSEKSVVELFYDNGILVNPKVNKDVFSGISRVKTYFNKQECSPQIYVFSSCTNLIRELKTYAWGEGDKPKKIDDHAVDELRYFVMTRPKPTEQMLVKSEIQRDKERLYRRLRANKR